MSTPSLPLLFCAVLFASQEASPIPLQAEESAKVELHKRNLGVMGTDLEIKVIDVDTDKAEKALDAAIAEIQRVEDMMTTWR
ncbi:MAG: hypothetical protein JKY61_03480, partial [Planctomycetes bacterium]|nr:hypothetical protein [Planctomycetota bacterium]